MPNIYTSLFQDTYQKNIFKKIYFKEFYSLIIIIINFNFKKVREFFDLIPEEFPFFVF